MAATSHCELSRMIVRMGLLRKRPISRQKISGGIGATCTVRWPPGCRAARLSAKSYRRQDAARDRSRPRQLGSRWFSELWFDDQESMQRAIASDAYQAVVEDSPNCMAGTTVIVAEQHVVVPLASDGPFIKRMSILERRRDLSFAEFREQWLGKHAGMVDKFPAIAGYTQNLVTQRGHAPRIDADDHASTVDGIVEMWFRNTDDLAIAFRSPAAVVSQTSCAGLPAEYHSVPCGSSSHCLRRPLHQHSPCCSRR